MINNYCRTFLFILLLLLTDTLLAQQKFDLQSQIPPAPNAAELGKYGTLPVGTLTGIPDISFPLYEIVSGSLKLPISLSYHASGNQVNQKASDVGLSWSVNAGGQISRTVYGAKDESQYGIFNYTPPSYSQLMGLYDYYLMQPYSKPGSDLEPDLFVYNIGGKSGKFFYGPNGVFQTIPFEPIKISKASSGGYEVSFQITDDNGTIYNFQNYAGTVSDLSPLMNIRSTWYLSSMISNNSADTIRFTYDTVQIDDQIKQQSYPIGKGETCVNNVTSIGTVNGDANGLIIDRTINIHYNELLVKKISFKDGSVEFKRNTSRVDDWPNYNKMLDQIVVSNNSNLVIKRIAFNHDYYVANVYNTEDSRRRLKLTGFTETGTDTLSLIKKNYNFDYNATPLPGYGKYAMDYWGYYNGADGNNSLIPTNTVYASDVNSVSFANGESFNNGFTGSYSWTYGNANREPDATYMKAGVLTKITYPTGGYSVLDYEPHQYISDVYPGQTKIGGGLRVKSIKSYNSDNKLLKQEIYKYGTNENGMGIKIFDERNFYRNYEDIVLAYYRQNMGGTCILDAAVWQRNFLGISKYNTLTYQVSPVLYSAVTKYEGDGTNNIGKTVSQYNVITGQTPMPDEFINSGNYGALNTTWHQGELIKETTYTNTGTQYVPLTKVTNEYSEYNQISGSGIVVKQFKQFIKICAECVTLSSTGPEPSSIKPGQGFYSIYQYPIPTGACRKTKETKVVYSQVNPSDSTTTITNYQYGNSANRFLTQSSISLSEQNSTKITRLKYPQDITGTVYSAMVSKNILTPVVEEKTVLSVSGNESQLSTATTNYKQVGNLFVPDNIKASTFSLLPETRIQYNQYDSYGNILEQQKTNDAKEVYLWSYGSHYPVAKIVGSDYSTVASVMSNNNIAQSQIDAAVSNDATMRSLLNGFRTYLPYAFVTTYTYSPLIGMTSQTDPNGLTTYYDYDTFGRLKNVRDKDQNILGRNYYHYYSDTSSDAPILTLGTTAITLPRTASYSSFAITSDCTWTVSSNQTWLTVSPTSGSLSSSVTVTATVNASYTRSATVTVTYGNGLTKVINITQLAGNNTLSTNLTRLNFGNAPGSLPVTVTSNTSWTVTTNKTWITTSPTSGTGNGTLTIMVSNLPNGDRSGTVTLTTTDGSTTVNISILQGAL